MDCPKCGSEVGQSRSCGCGWKSRSQREMMRDRSQSTAAAYKPCEWETDGERCRFPASIDDKWCTEHYRCDDPIWGGHVVSASQDYRHMTPQERVAQDNRRLIAEAKEYIEAQGLAKRDGEDSKAYIARLRSHCRGLFSGVVKQQRAA